jgi:asparagine synthase (glutamine-hydrolysing)
MLRFEIHNDDVAGRWSWRNNSWACGSSWITPVRSPELISDAFLADRGATITIREVRSRGDYVEMTLGADGVMCLAAGPVGVAPLYVATDGSWLAGSWDPAELAPFASVSSLSPVVVARLLTRRHRYSTETLFTRITRLTAGASLTWNATSGLALEYPPPAAHVVEPRKLRSGADPVPYFGALMDAVVRDVCERQRGAIAVELSGGLDSANVATSVAQMSARPILSGGLLLVGPTGPAQRVRRQTFVNHLGMCDIPVNAADHLPLAPDGPRSVEHAHYPDTDIYLEAFDALRGALRNAGARVVFTGYGGDEVMSRAPAERSHPTTPPRLPTWLDQRTRDALAHVDTNCSPVTAVALPTLLVFAARHPAYLRAGLWPIAPFTSPELSRFGRSLPVEWRTGKELLRQRLARTGLPPGVTHPRRPESFAATMRLALRRHAPALLADMLERSALIAHGFVRRNAVEHLYLRARAGHAPPTLVYDMLALHIGVHSMCTAAYPGEETSCPSSTPNH